MSTVVPMSDAKSWIEINPKPSPTKGQDIQTHGMTIVPRKTNLNFICFIVYTHTVQKCSVPHFYHPELCLSDSTFRDSVLWPDLSRVCLSDLTFRESAFLIWPAWTLPFWFDLSGLCLSDLTFRDSAFQTWPSGALPFWFDLSGLCLSDLAFRDPALWPDLSGVCLRDSAYCINTAWHDLYKRHKHVKKKKKI